MIELARQRAGRAGVDSRCRFHVADVRCVAYSAADAWFDLGCLQYVDGIDVALRRLTHVPDCLACLPRRGHPLNALRVVYRSMLKGNPFHAYSEKELRRLFGAWDAVELHQDGNKPHVASRRHQWS